jgi:hypothetical protein
MTPHHSSSLEQKDLQLPISCPEPLPIDIEDDCPRINYDHDSSQGAQHGDQPISFHPRNNSKPNPERDKILEPIKLLASGQ